MIHTIHKLQCSMEKLRRSIMYFLQAFFLLSLGHAVSFTNTSDRLALISFKNMITEDPLGVKISWNDSAHFCNWTGVTCSEVHHQRVIFLNLESLKLAGSISPSIGNLTFLEKIKLGDNNFGGEIPQELGRLSRLRHLDLFYNSFRGRLPSNLNHCTKLIFLDVSLNNLVGSIAGIGSLTNLVHLDLASNHFSGNLPPFLGNFSFLEYLLLHRNIFHGRIPNEIGQVLSLEVFNVQDNGLSGKIPSSLFNISSIVWFSVGGNHIEGHLPSDIGLTLPNLNTFIAGGNKFTGPIPTSFSNASRLQLLELPNNSFIGLVPKELGNLQDLVSLELGSNQLGSKSEEDENFDVLTYLVNCSHLQTLDLNDNRLRGKLPNFIANFTTQLYYFALGNNLIHGSIPQGIEKLTTLKSLGLEENFLSGKIPTIIGKLQNLNHLALRSNNFSGTIPSSLGNLTGLLYLHMSSNSLEGSLPSSLGKCQSLLELRLDSNVLTGTIPKQVFSLPKLTYFNLSSNFLYGSLPLEIGGLSNIESLAVSENRLSGEIPNTLSGCQKLEYLYMQGNSFEGTIFPLSALNGLRTIDLSRNNLSGEIPQFLANFALESLNLSFNGFHGAVPIKGVFTNASIVSLNGNMDVCGGILELHLSECPKHTSSKNISRKKVALVASGASLVFLFVLIFGVYWSSKTRNITSAAEKDDWPVSVSYPQLYKSTNGFSSDYLLGAGSYGSVYRACIHDGGPNVAMKVLHLQQRGASKSFLAECNALRNIRHRNLVKIITVCSSVDFQGNDFKALIFEFMPNGSLEKWLHPAVDELNQLGPSLSVVQKLSIAVDVTSALDYLHHHNEMPIAHCDLKPSNVLLDHDMTAHVGDFGLAKFLAATTNDPSSEQCFSSGLKGSIGYIPPEYGTGSQVSILGDVYSYGILLLEMFTGKTPTDDIFQDGLDLHEFSKMALTDRFMEVLDPLSFHPANVEDQVVIRERERNVDTSENGVRNNMQKCVVEVIRIGLSCSNPISSERPTMAEVSKKIIKIRNLYS